MTVKCKKKKIRKAAEFYAKKLGIAEDINIFVWTKKRIKDAMGYCSKVDDKNYIIAIQTKVELGEDDPLATLAHEMVHVKQYASGELIDTKTHCLWKGEQHIEYPVDADEYFFSPWEVEAFGMQVGLYHLYRSELCRTRKS